MSYWPILGRRLHAAWGLFENVIDRTIVLTMTLKVIFPRNIVFVFREVTSYFTVSCRVISRFTSHVTGRAVRSVTWQGYDSVACGIQHATRLCWNGKAKNIKRILIVKLYIHITPLFMYSFVSYLYILAVICSIGTWANRLWLKVLPESNHGYMKMSTYHWLPCQCRTYFHMTVFQ
jgi:hypothetical protein